MTEIGVTYIYYDAVYAHRFPWHPWRFSYIVVDNILFLYIVTTEQFQFVEH